MVYDSLFLAKNSTKKILLALTFVALLSGCGSDKWQGFYYPEGCLSCEDKYIYSPIFKTLDECRDWADATKQRRGNNSEDDYECGLNCEKKDGFNICKETTK